MYRYKLMIVKPLKALKAWYDLELTRAKVNFNLDRK